MWDLSYVRNNCYKLSKMSQHFFLTFDLIFSFNAYLLDYFSPIRLSFFETV